MGPSVSDGLDRVFAHYADRVGASSMSTKEGEGPNLSSGLKSAKNVTIANDRWNVGKFLRFCTEFSITEELSHLPLQRIYQDCSFVEAQASARHGVAGSGLQSSDDNDIESAFTTNFNKSESKVSGASTTASSGPGSSKVTKGPSACGTSYSHQPISKLGFQLSLVLIAVKLHRLEYPTSLEDQVVALLRKLNVAPGMKDKTALARTSMLFPTLPTGGAGNVTQHVRQRF